MIKKIESASDVKIGDFVVVHNAAYEMHELFPSSNIYGPKTFHASPFPTKVPYCIGNIGRILNADIGEKLSGKVITDVELILTSNTDMKFDKNSPLNYLHGEFKGEHLRLIN